MNAKDEGQQWDIHTLNGQVVAAKGEPRAGAEMRSLVGMCDLVNALQQQVAELARERDMLLGVVRFAVLQPSASHSISVSGLNDYERQFSPSTTIAQRPPEGLTPEEEIAWAESLPNAAGGAYTQEMTEAYTRAQFESSTIAQEEQR